MALVQYRFVAVLGVLGAAVKIEDTKISEINVLHKFLTVYQKNTFE